MLSRILLSAVMFAALVSPGCAPSAPAPKEKPSGNPEGLIVPSPDKLFVDKLQELKAKVKARGDGQVSEVDFRETQLGPELIAEFKMLTAVETILATGESVTDENLDNLLRDARYVRTLDVRDCAISNAALKKISKCGPLRVLRLSGKSGLCTIDDEGLATLAGCTKLKALSLDYLWVSETGLAALAPLQDLEEITLTKTLVGDEALAVLKQFPKLKKVRLSQTQVTSAGLQHLAEIKTLEDVDLSENSQVDDAGMAHIGQLTALKRLNLWRVPLTDAGVSSLAPLTSLEWLNLDNTQLSDTGLDALQGMTQLTFLHLGSTSITDAGLPKLVGLKSLKDLKVTRTAVTQAGVDELKKSLSETEIQLEYIVREEQ